MNKMNNKRKGFTIIELVIVIVVIAILAAVLIPTFSSIIDRANESADIQAVRQMNMALLAESAVQKPSDVVGVINILAEAGFNSQDKLVPVSKDCGFYWSSEANMIMLIKDEGDEAPMLIFPTEEPAVNTAFDKAKADWAAAINVELFDLEPSSEGILPDSGGDGAGDVVESIKTEEALIEALLAGEEVTLGDNITLSSAITINDDSEIDLNGFELTITDKPVIEGDPDATWTEYTHVITVSDGATLTIVNSGNSGKIVIDEDEENLMGNYYNKPPFYGIVVNEECKLEFNNVTIDGNRNYNIKNEGTVSLNNTNFTVSGYPTVRNYGIDNYGTANISNTNFTLDNFARAVKNNDGGEATINGGSVVAAGSDVAPICGDGGTMTIEETKFYEANDSVSYNKGMIEWSSAEALILKNVEITTVEDNTVYANNTANVRIENGTFNGAFESNGTSTITGATFTGTFTTGSTTITGGTFKGEVHVMRYANVTIESGTFEKVVKTLSSDTTININDGTFNNVSCMEDSDIYIYGGTFNGKLSCAGGGVSDPTITITGGTFSDGTNTVNYADITETSVFFVGNQCKLTQGENCWIISKQ